ncbi:MAG: alanine--tRNA ligase [bacterium]|nr:alanine--tRNA ligase [bacterium]
MTLDEVRKKYLDFFNRRGHTIIPSASLVPENDPTTLFTGSGMQPLLPYLLGQTHPAGNRLVNSQKCFRSEDIDEVGDNRHTTFFEMLGNWSLGDYFKEDQLFWLFQFLTDEVKLDPKKLYVTVFAGEPKYGIPKDTESVALWKKIFSLSGILAKDVELGSIEHAATVGTQEGKIFYYDSKKNWWSRAGVPENMPVGEPGGPDSEIFYEFESIVHDLKFGLHCHPNCDCGHFMEIGNSVFMEYLKTEKGFEKLAQRNVDFGGGLERIVAASQDNPDVFKIDLFSNIISRLETITGRVYDDSRYTKSFRIIADHLRASLFIIGDGVIPSNVERGYFVRRLLRRAVRHLDILSAGKSIAELVPPLIDSYKICYPVLHDKRDEIATLIIDEEKKFRKTLDSGLREFKKIAEKTEKISDQISGKEAFTLFTSHGLPIDIIVELAAENPSKGMFVNIEAFEQEFKKHQEISRIGTEKKFKGGMSDHSEMSLKYHTATHMLNAALQSILGEHVGQKGSNITPERLRFDFSHGERLAPEEIGNVESLVNRKIKEALPVSLVEMTLEEAKLQNITGVFDERYGEKVKVYSIGNAPDYFSREICGGPHVENTGVLGTFKILKEEAVSAGVRRIKAVLQ